MHKLTIAVCTYNRSDRLENLVAAMRAQVCPIPYEILAVNNNSQDNTIAILEDLAARPGAPLRFVTETTQGIVPARNRAIEESLDSDIMVFIDDDELPQSGLLHAAYDAIVNEGAQCAGGRVEVDFTPHGRPAWLDAEIAGFLGGLDHGATPFWIQNDSTPIWSGNIAYDMRLFRDDPALRFDKRYNREGAGMGGGEDAILFRALLARGTKIRYRPDMVVDHFVEPWRLKRSYFLKVHYVSGFKNGFYEFSRYPRELFGIPLFLFPQLARHAFTTLKMYATGQHGALRQAMNMTHAMGLIAGCFARWRGAEG